MRGVPVLLGATLLAVLALAAGLWLVLRSPSPAAGPLPEPIVVPSGEPSAPPVDPAPLPQQPTDVVPPPPVVDDDDEDDDEDEDDDD